MHRFFLLLSKNPHLRGFQWVFTPFLQVLNEWIFTAVLTAVYVNIPGPESTQMCCTGLIWTVCVLLGLRKPHGDNK